MLKNILKKLTGIFLKEYGLYKIYICEYKHPIKVKDSIHLKYEEVSQKELQESSDKEIRDQSWYGGDESICFACKYKGKIVGVLCVWYGERYKTRDSWPIAENEAKFVQIITSSEVRGKGLGYKLAKFTEQSMKAKGFKALYARMWFTNYAPIRIAIKAGWIYVGILIELYPVLLQRKFKIIIDFRRNYIRLPLKFFKSISRLFIKERNIQS